MEKLSCECPICLEPFEVPRGLPCLHNFCTKCLQWHIDNNQERGSFTCPMCRANTTPPDQSIHSSMWANSFPIANIVCELMSILRIKEEQKTSSNDCDSCLYQNIHTDSTAFCKTCVLNFCENCSENHSIRFPKHRIMLERNSLLLSSFLHQQQGHEDDRFPTCPTHKNTTLDLYCSVCETFICLKCTFGKHASCAKSDGVKSIDVVAEERKITDHVEVTKLQKGYDEMNKLITDTDNAKKNLSDSKEKNEIKIEQMFDAMIASLQMQKAKTKRSLEETFDKRFKYLEELSLISQRRLKGLDQRISKLQSNLEIENTFEYICESKKADVTDTVGVMLPLDFSVKSGLTFSVNPEFGVILNDIKRIDIGNAFIALDKDYEKMHWCKFETYEKFIVKVYSADIITAKVDVIVNPTDDRLTHSGEISKRVTLAAGPEISAENKKIFRSYGEEIQKLDFSDVFITRAGNLDYKFILHAVIPDYKQILQNKKLKTDFEDMIAKTVSNSLFVANSLRVKSVALPTFCFHPNFADSCAKGYLKGILKFSKKHCTDSTNSLAEVHFVNTNLHATHYLQVIFKEKLNTIYDRTS